MHANSSKWASPEAYRVPPRLSLWRRFFALIDAWYAQGWVNEEMRMQWRLEMSERELARQLPPHIRKDLGLPPF